MAFDVREQISNDSKGAAGCAMCWKRLTAVVAGWGDRVHRLSRLACNFIIAFRCMFPVVAFTLAINCRLIAHTHLLHCAAHACGALSFILSELRGQRQASGLGRGTQN